MDIIKKRNNIKNIFLVPAILFLFLPYSLFAQTASSSATTTTATTTEPSFSTSILSDIQRQSQIQQQEFIQKGKQQISAFQKILDKKLEKVKAGYVDISTDPKYPEPNQSIKISLISYLFDLNRAKIYWYVNGSLYKSGIGVQEINIMSGDSGEGTSINVVANTIEGNKIEKHTTIMPIEMTLLWEADTYTPPFYKGKALLSPESIIKIIALPNIKLKNQKVLNPNNLVYMWIGEGRSDSFSDVNNSGYGKNILYTQAPLPTRDNTIEVDVSSLDNSIKSSKSIKIESVDPNILFYEDDPIKGVLYGRAMVDNFNLKKQEIQLRAEPYFFSTQDKNVGNLTYEWYVNDKKVNKSGQEITFRQENKKNVGFSNISIDIRNTYRKFQQAVNSFVLNF